MPVTAEELASDRALAHGWLAKRGSKNKSFKRRFSVLRVSATFTYYNKATDKKPLGVVDAGQYIAVPQSGTGSGGRALLGVWAFGRVCAPQQ